MKEMNWIWSFDLVMIRSILIYLFYPIFEISSSYIYFVNSIIYFFSLLYSFLNSVHFVSHVICVILWEKGEVIRKTHPQLL